jgi:hypothetical protein
MMVSDIQPGDLVMVIKPIECCSRPAGMGHVFVVEAAAPPDGLIVCLACMVARTSAGYFFGDGGRTLWHHARLKKINPPAVEDSEYEQRELSTIA